MGAHCTVHPQAKLNNCVLFENSKLDKPGEYRDGILVGEIWYPAVSH